jgi:hypothetical protein
VVPDVVLVVVENADVVPGLEDGLLTFEKLVVPDDPVPDVTPSDEDSDGVGAGGVEVGAGGVEVGAGGVEVGAGGVEVGAGGVEVGAGVCDDPVFTLLGFDDVGLELSAKESGNAYCGKIKIAESKSGIKNLAFILSHLRWGVNKKL